jgi:hypothetical protein
MDFREREIGIHRPHRLTDRGHQCTKAPSFTPQPVA